MEKSYAYVISTALHYAVKEVLFYDRRKMCTYVCIDTDGKAAVWHPSCTERLAEIWRDFERISRFLCSCIAVFTEQ